MYGYPNPNNSQNISNTQNLPNIQRNSTMSPMQIIKCRVPRSTVRTLPNQPFPYAINAHSSLNNSMSTYSTSFQVNAPISPINPMNSIPPLPPMGSLPPINSMNSINPITSSNIQ